MAYIFFFYIYISLLGLAVGSFLNCIIHRLKTKESFLLKRSYCPYCKHTLGFWDLIPVLSFFILGGKCRYCKKPISLQYPLVELSTGILFVVVSYYSFQELPITGYSFLVTIFRLLVTSFLIIVFVYDLKHYIIPDKVIYPAIFISFLYNFLYSKSYIMNSICSALGVALFFLLIFFVSRGKWLGFGDVKLAFLMGLFLGFPQILVALFSAFFLGAIIGVGLILAGKKKLKSEVPFGPFLVTGTFIALFWSNCLVDWYLQFFLL